MSGLTPRQAEVLNAVRTLSAGGIAPTFEEIGRATGTGRGAAHKHLLALKRRGVLTWTPGLQRSFKLLDEALPIPTLEAMPLDALRRHIAIASGILAQRSGGGAGAGGSQPHSRAPAGRAETGGVLTCGSC